MERPTESGQEGGANARKALAKRSQLVTGGIKEEDVNNKTTAPDSGSLC